MITELLLVAIIVWSVVSRFDDPLARFKGGNGRSPEEHLAYLVVYMREHGLAPAQVAQAFETLPVTAKAKRSTGDMLSKLMYLLGALFVFAGIGVYMAMFWETMSPAVRILSTLGTGMGLSVLSVVAMKEGKYPKAITPLIIAAALTQFGGWFVFLHEMFPHGDDVRRAALFCCAMMAFQQALVFYNFRGNALALTVIAFAYGALQAALSLQGMHDEHIALLLGGSLIFTAHILQSTPQRQLSPLLFVLGAGWFNAGLYTVIEHASNYHWAAMITGVSLMSFGLAMRATDKSRLEGLALFVGSCLAYGGLFEEVRHTPFELTYLGIAVAMMYGSALLHSRALLVTSVLAILGFIGYYTSEHFMNSASWPIALMLMGVAFLAVGTVAVRVKRRAGM